jgi:hypothetical protein
VTRPKDMTTSPRSFKKKDSTILSHPVQEAVSKIPLCLCIDEKDSAIRLEKHTTGLGWSDGSPGYEKTVDGDSYNWSWNLTHHTSACVLKNHPEFGKSPARDDARIAQPDASLPNDSMFSTPPRDRMDIDAKAATWSDEKLRQARQGLNLETI